MQEWALHCCGLRGRCSNTQCRHRCPPHLGTILVPHPTTVGGSWLLAFWDYFLDSLRREQPGTSRTRSIRSFPEPLLPVYVLHGRLLHDVGLLLGHLALRRRNRPTDVHFSRIASKLHQHPALLEHVAPHLRNRVLRPDMQDLGLARATGPPETSSRLHHGHAQRDVRFLSGRQAHSVFGGRQHVEAIPPEERFGRPFDGLRHELPPPFAEQQHELPALSIPRRWFTRRHGCHARKLGAAFLGRGSPSACWIDRLPRLFATDEAAGVWVWGWRM
mmetsp:Transcript_9294/g.20520  ORF Transcript_9294/g.20520 Transcript_9294/m.20520 type:complete len:274 (+) Transcript_9294:690-1511(+)